MVKQQYRETWNGYYNGIGYEIAYWRLGDEYVWNYYIYINIEQLPEELQDRYWLKGKWDMVHKYVEHDYTNSPIGHLDWHHGCTYYEKQHGHDGEPRIVKAGCDYNHYWDNGVCYSLDDVTNDVSHTIDSFLLRCPEYKMRCAWDGQYYSRDEGEFSEDGRFRSYKSKEESGSI